jgi:ParB family chromosome partitioning protein
LEEIVRREKRRRPRGDERAAPRSEKTPHLRDLEERCSVAAGTKVSIQQGRRKGTGRIVIEYYSLDDFDRILERLGVENE